MKRRSQKGNAMIEFALSWAVMSLLFTGIFDYGWSFWTYNRLLASVQNGAEAASLMNLDIGDTSSYTTAVQNTVVYGDPTGTSTTKVVPGLSTSNVSITPYDRNGNVTTLSNYPAYITVSITSYTINTIFGSHTFNKPRVTVQFLGRITCSSC